MIIISMFTWGGSWVSGKVISPGFATTVYFFASHRLTSAKASSYVFIVPFSAVIFSWIFLGEIPKMLTITGGLVTILAVYLINLKGENKNGYG